jgi:hypothetical protein
MTRERERIAPDLDHEDRRVEERPRCALRCGCDDASFCAANAAELALLPGLVVIASNDEALVFLKPVNAATP